MAQIMITECDGCKQRIEQVPVGWLRAVVNVMPQPSTSELLFCSFNCMSKYAAREAARSM